MRDLNESVLRWLSGPNTGLSSEAMAFCACGIKPTNGWSGKEHPYDPADFNRCLLLVVQIPDIKNHFPKIAKLSSRWAQVISHWNELESLFINEVGLNWSKGRSAPQTYQRMQEILEAEPCQS